MRTAACEVWHSSTASLHVCEVKSTCFVAALHAGKQAVLSLNGFYRAITGWLGPATPRKWALATSQQHIRLVEPPRGASRSVGRRRPSTNFASRRSTARGGSFAELERTRVLRAVLHRVQHASRHCADGVLSARQGSDGMTARECTVGPLTVACCGPRAASWCSMHCRCAIQMVRHYRPSEG